MLRHRGCQWRFDWQRHRGCSANGDLVWQLVVMRMGRQGRGFVSAQPCNGINIYPLRHRCVPPASWQSGEDSHAHTHSTAPILQITAAKRVGERGKRGGTGAEVEGV